MTRRSWLMMGGAAAVWGASYMFIKVALDDFSEGAIVCIRTALGAVVLLALARRWDALAPLRGRWRVGGGDRLRAGRRSRSCSSPSARTTSTPSWPASSSRPRRSSPRCSRWASTTTSARRAGPRSASSSACSGSSCSSASTCRAAATRSSAALMVLLRQPLLRGRGDAPQAQAARRAARRRGRRADGRGGASSRCRCASPTCPTTPRASRPSASLVAARRGGHRHRLPVVLHADLGDRPGARVDHRATSRRASASSTASSCSARPFSVAAVGGLALILAGSWLAVGGRASSRRWRAREPLRRAACRRARSPSSAHVATARASGLHVPLVTPFDEARRGRPRRARAPGRGGARRRRRRAGRPGHDGRGVVAGRARARRGRRASARASPPSAAPRSSSAPGRTTRARPSRATRRWPRSRA